MPHPRVSVVVPTFNRIAWLPKAIASVMAQTLPVFELIVVDDGSTDATDEWIRGVSAPQLRYLRREHTGSISATRNVGVQAAVGEWIAFLDSDDSWLPDKLARQFDRLRQSPDSAWCYGNYRLVDRFDQTVPNTTGRPWRPFEGWIAERILTTEVGVTVQTILLKADLAKALEFDTRISLSEDYEFALRLATLAPCCVADGILAEILVHPERTTTRAGGYLGHLGKAMTYRKAARELNDPTLRRIARRQLRSHIRTLIRLGVRDFALGELVRSARALSRV